jgi:sugar lactone lactonase YvrE
LRNPGICEKRLLDNVTFIGQRTFVSHAAGSIYEIVEPGRTKPLVDGGLVWPLGIAVDGQGKLFVADGGYCHSLVPGEELELLGMLFSPGFPGWVRDVVSAVEGEWIVTTANGTVARWRPAEQEHEELANGYGQLMGVAIASSGEVIFADYASGRVLSVQGERTTNLADGLDGPTGVAIGADDAVYVAEAGAGRVAQLSGGRTQTVVDGLRRPHGIAVVGNKLYIADTGTKELVEYDLATDIRRSIATNLPIGAPPGVEPKFLAGVDGFCGPMTSMTGIAAGADGTLYVSGDAEGSVLAISPL